MSDKRKLQICFKIFPWADVNVTKLNWIKLLKVTCQPLKVITDNVINRLMRLNLTRLTNNKLLFHTKCTFKIICLMVSLNQFISVLTLILCIWFNMITENAISHLLWSCFQFVILNFINKSTYCYHSVNVISFSLSQSDHIQRLPLYFNHRVNVISFSLSKSGHIKQIQLLWDVGVKLLCNYNGLCLM